MVKISDPYLKSGESIILTTDRVRVNSVQYDVLLTTRHLVLVDTGQSRFQPSMYPLRSILSVKGGKTANGELVISLFFHETEGKEESAPMVLVFTRQPGEQRISERDDWIKKLMKCIVSDRHETTSNSSSTAESKRVVQPSLQPSLRRTFAPEMALPYKTAPDTRPAHTDLIVIPDEPEAPAFPEGAEPEENLTKPAVDETPTGIEPGSESPDSSSLPLQEPEVTPIVSEQGSESPDSSSFPILEPEVTPTVSEPGSESPDSSSFPILEPEVIPTVSEQGTESPDSSSFPILEPEVTPTVSEPGSESPDSSSFPILEPEVIPTVSEQGIESPDSSSLPLLEPEVTPIVSEPGTESPDSSSFPILEPEVTPIVSEPGTESPDSSSFPILEPEVIPTVSEQGTESPDSSSLPLQEPEVTPTVSEPGSESPDSIMPPEATDIVPSTEIQEENAGSLITPETSITEDTPLFTHKDTGNPDQSLPPEQIVTDSQHNSPEEEPERSETKISPEGAVHESSQQPVAEVTPSAPETPPPSPRSGSRRAVIIAVTAIVLIIFAIAIVGLTNSADRTQPVVEPVSTPTSTLQQTPVPTAVIIPQTGVWVRVGYPGLYYGWLGSPGSLRGINGSGDQIYKMPENAVNIQVNMYKQDNSGNTLAVDVYRDGKIINSRSISMPMGSIELLIDAKTGDPPGLSPVVTQTDNKTSSGGRVLYF